jgi:hypothetical protein
MTQLLRLVSHRIHNWLLPGCVLGIWLTTTPVMAEYQPPADQKSPAGYTQSTGSRGGCEVNGETALTTLAPQRHIGQTTSTHPTFAWFVPDSKSLPLEFALYKYTPSGDIKLAYKTGLRTTPGIMKLSLPKSHLGLMLGERYIWQIAMLCDPNHPSNDVVAKAEIERVEMSPTLASKLFKIRDRTSKIELYAQAGLWYDALGETLWGASQKEAGSLLEELAQLEEPGATSAVSQQCMNLRQIARSKYAMN